MTCYDRHTRIGVRTGIILILFFHAPGLALEDSGIGVDKTKLDASSPLLVGKLAPPLSIDKLIMAPEGSVASWPALKGKCVILEFWATWCAPCVASIPHLNELSEKFKDRPVVFISVTDEKEDKVTQFLKKRPIKGWIGLAPESLFKDYQIRGIPRTVLVDAKGIVAGITSPRLVTPETIEALMAGRPLDLPAEDDDDGLRPGIDPSKDGEAEPPLYQITIRPSDPSNRHAQSASGGGKTSLIGSSAMGILSAAFEIPPHRIDSQATLPMERFDVIASMPRGREDLLQPTLRDAVEVVFGIKTRTEQRETDVLVLVIPSGGKHKLTPTAMPEDGGTSMSSWHTGIEMMGESFESFVKALAGCLKKPVVNETGLSDRYDISLAWERDNPESVIAAVRDTLGLELKPDKRKVEFLIVEDADEEPSKELSAAGGTK